MTYAEWNEELATRTPEEMAAARAALETLRDWPAFNREFKWTHIFLLVGEIDREGERRDRAARAAKAVAK